MTETDRWFRFEEILEPLRHLPTRYGLGIGFVLDHSYPDDKWFQHVWNGTMQFLEKLNLDTNREKVCLPPSNNEIHSVIVNE